MSLAWETTDDDIQTVLDNHKCDNITEEGLNDLFMLLDHDAIEKAALYGHDIDEQTAYAHQEIADQLRREGTL